MSFLKSLETPDHPLLGPTLWGLKLWRIWQPTRSSPIIIYNLFHVYATVFVISQYIELWLNIDDLELALRNLSVTMLSTICMVKCISFISWHDDWKSVFEYVSNLEKSQLSKKDRITSSIINEYTKYSRSITYFYWSLVTASVFILLLAPLFGWHLSSSDRRYLIKNGTAPYPELLSAWLPFDRTRGYGYWFSVLEHSSVTVYGGGVVANFDANAVVLMSFFHGQLKMLSTNCERLFGENNERIGYDEAVKRIKACHNHHVGLVRFSSVMNSLLSPVMFMYVIICSLMICASAIQLSTDGTETMQRIWIAEYLLALIAQLFLYCWHSNEVLHMSDKVEEGVYKSAWWSQNVRIRRSVTLLGGQLRKRIVFSAGPFTDLTVATFVAIMKGSYSFYTLLNKK